MTTPSIVRAGVQSRSVAVRGEGDATVAVGGVSLEESVDENAPTVDEAGERTLRLSFQLSRPTWPSGTRRWARRGGVVDAIKISAQKRKR